MEKMILASLIFIFFFISCTPSVENDDFKIGYINNSQIIKQTQNYRNYLMIDANYKASIYKNGRDLGDSTFKKVSIFLQDSSFYKDYSYHLLLQKKYYTDTLFYTSDSSRVYLSQSFTDTFKVHLADSMFTCLHPKHKDSLAVLISHLSTKKISEDNYIFIDTLTATEDSLSQQILKSNKYFKSIGYWLEELSDTYMN